ncbi:hypothetical protein NIIDMKKI_29700 [Mycobacterium kansasii]|uniref:Uncharacterized protein n=1 Tax=Mycobacterium kansasii TaxID=1768 RepID=A0A7G1IBE6_MYCKA|nr:hypothetical protein NIIDMKKI_29700 [Mycobacterium kansasii]
MTGGPGASFPVDTVHHIGSTGHDPDGHAAAKDLGVADDIRCDTEVCRRAAGMDAEPGEHLVEGQQHILRPGDVA